MEPFPMARVNGVYFPMIFIQEVDTIEGVGCNGLYWDSQAQMSRPFVPQRLVSQAFFPF